MTKAKDSLVKIDSKLYDKIREISKKNRIEYPSIKNFVEKSIKQEIEFSKLRSFNVDEALWGKAKIIKKGGKNFTVCVVCGKIFLCNRKDVKKGRNACPSCRDIVLDFSSILRK